MDAVGEGFEEVDLEVVCPAFFDHGPEGAAGGGFGALYDLFHVVLFEEEGQLGFLMFQNGLKVVYWCYFPVRYIGGVTGFMGRQSLFIWWGVAVFGGAVV